VIGILFLITVAAGLLPLFFKAHIKVWMPWLLTFTGSFLLGVTTVHLLPESFELLHFEAGWLVLCGFFFQFFLQRYTHGLEHGHDHSDHASHGIVPMFIGMFIHAFMEGMPLGLDYQEASAKISVLSAIAGHKIPEVILIAAVAMHYFKSPSKVVGMVVCFALMSPLAALLSAQLGEQFTWVAQMVTYALPFVAGAFIHIATTIFFESSSQSHKLSWQRILAIALGLLLAYVMFKIGHAGHNHVH
jgi:zinc and cadmium transporter